MVKILKENAISTVVVLVVTVILPCVLSKIIEMGSYYHKRAQLSYWNVEFSAVLKDDAEYAKVTDVIKFVLFGSFLLISLGYTTMTLKWQCTGMGDLILVAAMDIVVSMMLTLVEAFSRKQTNRDYTMKDRAIVFLKKLLLMLGVFVFFDIREVIIFGWHLIIDGVWTWKNYTTEDNYIRNLLFILCYFLYPSVIYLFIDIKNGRIKERNRKDFEIVIYDGGQQYVVVFSGGQDENTIIQKAVIDGTTLKIDTSEYLKLDSHQVLSRSKKHFTKVYPVPEPIQTNDIIY